MSLTGIDKHYPKIKQAKRYLELRGEISLPILKKERPLVFILKKIEQTSLYRIKSFLPNLNYVVEVINPKTLIGVRADLHALGFDLYRLKSFLSSNKYTKDLIEEEILAVLNQHKDICSLSRQDELEILSCFLSK